jgi:PKD repeat protein
VIGTHTAYLIFWDPRVAHLAASASRPHIGQSVAFTAILPSAADGSAYDWNFGDGTSATTLAPTVAHAFTTPGHHTVTLTVAGQTATLTCYVLHNPAVWFTLPRAPLRPGQPVRFRAARLVDPDGVITSWTWRFGDGTGARGRSVSHAYAVAGRYRVTLTVRDTNGSVASRTARVIVRAAARRLRA